MERPTVEFLECPFPDCGSYKTGDKHVLVNRADGHYKCLYCGKEGHDINNYMLKLLTQNSSLSYYRDRAIFEISNYDTLRGCPSGWPSLDMVIQGVRKHEFTIITGATGSGKTTWGLSLMQQLSQQDEEWKFLILSGEDRGSRVLRKLVSANYREVAGERHVEEFINQYENRFYILNVFDVWEDADIQMTIPALMTKINEYIKIGVNFIFIDHAHLFIREGENEIEDIRRFCQFLRQMVTKFPVHVFLVVQPTKLQKDQRKVTMRNLRGSVIWEQSAWNVLNIHREDESNHLVEVEIEKNREFGTLGSFMLEFDVNTQSNYYEVKT